LTYVSAFTLRAVAQVLPGSDSTPIVKLFDRVSLDGRPGTAVGFFSARRKRSVLVRFDHAEVLAVPEAELLTLAG